MIMLTFDVRRLWQVAAAWRLGGGGGGVQQVSDYGIVSVYHSGGLPYTNYRKLACGEMQYITLLGDNSPRSP